jgi:hypothetical protein
LEAKAAARTAATCSRRALPSAPLPMVRRTESRGQRKPQTLVGRVGPGREEHRRPPRPCPPDGRQDITLLYFIVRRAVRRRGNAEEV